MRASRFFRDAPARMMAGLLVAAATAVACSSSSDATTATSLGILSGNGQSATVGTSVASALVVQVKDGDGNPMSGVMVTFLASGGASVSNSTVTTDASGNASTSLTLGTRSGTDSVTATAAGISSPQYFTFTANAGAATMLTVVSGNNQTATSGSNLASALVVQAADQYGNLVSGATIDWTTNAGALAGTTQATTSSTGTASAALTLPAAPAVVLVTATLHGTVTAAIFTETAT